MSAHSQSLSKLCGNTLAAIAIFLAMAGSSTASERVFVNGQINTQDASNPWAQAIIVDGDKIKYGKISRKSS